MGDGRRRWWRIKLQDKRTGDEVRGNGFRETIYTPLALGIWN
jgi:hypothetical protein